MIPAPGSTSEVYRPNPSAIVVVIDPGHGGCLDWGVPNPYDNKVAKSEKADTLGIALALRDLLAAQGITVVLTRNDDSALAGDLYPPLGCQGAPFRDVNGDPNFMRSHHHSVSTYVQAFRYHGLTVVRCAEPCWDTASAKAQFPFVSDALARDAVAGLPMALIWELERD